MDLLNAILTGLVDLLMVPLGLLPGPLVLVVWAALAGVVAGLAFRCTSNQRALRAVGDRVRANLLAMRLFKDELGVTLRCQGGLLMAAALRFWYALPALAAMLVPFVLLLVQLALRFEHRPLRPGEAAVVELRVDPAAWSRCQDARLEAPDGLRVETPALRDRQAHALYWRIRPQAEGRLHLRWRLDGRTIEKDVRVAGNPDRLPAVNVQRAGRGLWQRLVHAGEPALPADGPVCAVRVHYPQRSTPIFGWDVPWWLTFLVASIVIAFLLRPVLKVRF